MCYKDLLLILLKLGVLVMSSFIIFVSQLIIC